MYKLSLMVLALLCILSVVAATPRGLKQAKIKRGEDHKRAPEWGNKPKPSKG